MRFAISLAVVGGVLASALVAAPEPALTFKDVKPIFDQRCLSCHGAEYPGGKFRVDSYNALMKGGEHGKAVVPGKSSDSRLMKMLKGTLKPRMPMDGKALPRPELEKISKWITQGARR